MVTSSIGSDAVVAPHPSEVVEQLCRAPDSAAGTGVPSGTPLLDGDHPLLDHVRTFAERVSSIPVAQVLITGESGTGKTLLARLIHERSRARGPFVAVNCAGLPPALLESELFGHERGAFTDARATKRGLAEVAQHGTLFLDEIGTLPLELQAKLLSFLEAQEIRRVGGTQPIRVQARVVAATNEDLHQRVRDRSFRADLLYRLDVAGVEMPPLRRMRSIIPTLARRFTQRISAEFHRPPPLLRDHTFDPLVLYAWPGNVRELRNVIARALIFHTTGPFRVVPPERDAVVAPDQLFTAELGLTLEELERRYLQATLRRAGERPFDDVAAALGISRKTLWEKRRRYHLDDAAAAERVPCV